MLKFLAFLFRRSAFSVSRPVQTPVAHGDGESAGAANLAVMRHAVLNRDKKVIGYEFFQPDAAKADESDLHSEWMFLKFLESLATDAMLGKRHALATVSARQLFDPALEKLAGTGVAVMVQVDSQTHDWDSLIARMQALQQLGMLLGLSDGRNALLHPELGKCVSLAFLPVDQIIAPDLLQAIRSLRAQQPHIQLLACGVNSYEEFEVCCKLRMQAFTGPFVTHRRDWQDKPIDPGTLRLCKLVNSLRTGAEMEAITEEIKLDPLLSYRILCYANSAAIGAKSKVLALKDAIMLIGREPLFRWLVLLLCASAPSQSDNSALLENALIRGRMMEMLATEHSPAASADFFLTGVLSLLDVILQVPAASLLEALDLPPDVKAALQDRTGPYAGLLRLAEASEQTRSEGIHDICTELGIEAGKFSEAHNAALIWARGQQDDDADDTAFLLTPPVAVTVATPPNATEAPATPEAVSEAADPLEPEAQLALLQQAAHQGDMEAQYNLAVMHEKGLAGEQDLAQAFHWFSEAAQQGLPTAQERLGMMYAVGQSVTQDLVEAYKWLFIACKGLPDSAKANLAHCHDLLDADQVMEAESRAERWIQDHPARRPIA